MKTMKNVLVCEDDPVQLKILTTLIDQAGYRSLAARTPSEAVTAARRCGVDAVLADVQLQDGNAFDLLGDLRRIGFDAPVFMASAYATEGMKERAHTAGVKRFFDKPFDLRQIREQVDEALKVSPKLDATLLIVEDHAQVRAQLERTAVEAGFEILSAADGTQALDLLLNHESPIDLMLTDLHAHGSSGAKFIRKAREVMPSLHVVMMSGDASRDEIREGYEAGAAALVRKPVSTTLLQHLLKASLKAARARHEEARRARERRERIAAEPSTRRISRWLKSYLHAPARSRKGGRVIGLAFGAAALLIGVGSAWALQGALEAADRFETMAARALEAATPAATGAAKAESMLNRFSSTEQLRLMREANDVTRRYYEGHLQELRFQNLPKPAPQMPVPAAMERALPSQR